MYGKKFIVKGEGNIVDYARNFFPCAFLSQNAIVNVFVGEEQLNIESINLLSREILRRHTKNFNSNFSDRQLP